MSTAVLATLGIASAVTNIVGLAPYLRDIFKHKTKPERATWWIWSLLSSIALWAQFAAGAKWSLLFTAAQLIGVLTIASLSVKYGFGKFHKKDFISIAIAFFGLILWRLTHDPLSALIIVVFIDALALGLTIYKTWKEPTTETLSAWAIASVSGLLAILAVGELKSSTLIYPLYVFAGNTLLTTIIYIRRRSITLPKD